MGWFLIALFYFVVPYFVYHTAVGFGWSRLIGWVAAIVVVPIGVFSYARLFERLKHRGQRK